MSAYDYISTRATLIIAVIMALVGFVLGRQRYVNRMPRKW